MAKTIKDYNFPLNLNPTSKSDVFYFLIKIYNDKSQRLFVENIFKNIFPEIYQDFISKQKLFPKTFKFSQKMYHFLQDDMDCKLGLCKICGKRSGYLNMKTGYNTYCSKKCVEKDHDYIQEKTKKTCVEKYGCEFTFQTENNKSKSKQTKLERYGNETFTNPNKSKQTKLERYGSENYNNLEKHIRTCLDKYGVEYYSQSDKSRENIRQYMLNRTQEEKTEQYNKSKQTKLERYGSENYNNKDKTRLTCLDKYGVEYYLQTEESKNHQKEICKNRTQKDWNDISQKSKQTKLKKYGDENYNNREKYQQTCLDVYGVNHYSKTNEFIERIKETSQEKYGTDFPQQNDKIKEKIFNTITKQYGGIGFASPELNRKTQDTINDLYGCPVYSQSDDFKEKQKVIVNKQHQTKRKKGTFHSTKVEYEVSIKLNELGIIFEPQYKSNDYPYLCDFYLPKYDLYIEIQGYWCHGNHPFNKKDKKDLDLLKFWKEKSKEHKQYNQAIYVWTISDPNKRQTAKENKLNYLEIFSSDFNYCIDKIKEKINELEN